MRCPRCGGKTTQQRLGHFMRYICLERECQHTFTDQIEATPPYRQVVPDELPDRRD